MFGILTGAPIPETIKELARAMQFMIIWVSLVMVALVLWLGYLQGKLGKFKKQIRQLEDWKIQLDARLSPKA